MYLSFGMGKPVVSKETTDRFSCWSRFKNPFALSLSLSENLHSTTGHGHLRPPMKCHFRPVFLWEYLVVYQVLLTEAPGLYFSSQAHWQFMRKPFLSSQDFCWDWAQAWRQNLRDAYCSPRYCGWKILPWQGWWVGGFWHNSFCRILPPNKSEGNRCKTRLLNWHNHVSKSEEMTLPDCPSHGNGDKGRAGDLTFHRWFSLAHEFDHFFVLLLDHSVTDNHSVNNILLEQLLSLFCRMESLVKASVMPGTEENTVLKKVPVPRLSD